MTEVYLGSLSECFKDNVNQTTQLIRATEDRVWSDVTWSPTSSMMTRHAKKNQKFAGQSDDASWMLNIFAYLLIDDLHVCCLLDDVLSV